MKQMLTFVDEKKPIDYFSHRSRGPFEGDRIE